MLTPGLVASVACRLSQNFLLDVGMTFGDGCRIPSMEEMTMPNFKGMPKVPTQLHMFPESIDAAIPADSNVRVLSEVMDRLDWSKMERSYSETGRPAYPPKVLGKILAYAYSNGVRSSRKIEELVENDKRYIWLAGGLTPDFHTLARFRRDKWSEIRGLYEDSVRVCAECGLVFLNVVAFDGSKIPAAGSKKSVYGEKRLSREREAVERVLREAEEADRAEDELYGSGNGRELPADLRDAVARKAKIEEIADRLKESKATTTVVSEPESRVMKTTTGHRPAYNMQAGVDAENQVIVAMTLTNSETDHGQLASMVSAVEANTSLSPDTSLADCGYSDEATLKWADEMEQEVLIASRPEAKSDRNNLFASRCFLAEADRDVLICPAGRELQYRGEYKMGSGMYRIYAATGCRGCSFREECVGERCGSRRVSISSIGAARQKMREKLATEQGKKTFSLRKQVVEPVFGQIKQGMRFDRFLLSGLEGASAEAALICMVHNLKKCAKTVYYSAQRAHLSAVLLLRGAAQAFSPANLDTIHGFLYTTVKPARIPG